MEQKKKRVRPTLTQMRALQDELADIKERCRLQVLTEKHLKEEIEALKLKLKEASERYGEVGLQYFILEGQSQAEEKILRRVICEYKRKLESQVEGTSMLVKDCDIWRDKYRGLKAMFDDQVEGTSMLVADCDGWRKKYRDLLTDYNYLKHGSQKLKFEEKRIKFFKDNYAILIRKKATMSKELSELRTKNNILETSNKELKTDLERIRVANQSLNELNDKRLCDIRNLKSRGLWARILNKDY